MLDIFKYDVYRGPNIGLYTAVNDDHVFVPNGFAKSKAKHLSDYLKVDSVFTSMANTRLLGAMMVVNNQGILLPSNASPHEYENLKKLSRKANYLLHLPLRLRRWPANATGTAKETV